MKDITKGINLEKEIPNILRLASKPLNTKRLLLILIMLYKENWKNYQSLEQSTYRALRNLVKKGIIKKEGKCYVI